MGEAVPVRNVIELLLTNNCNQRCPYCSAQTDDVSYTTIQGKINEHGDYKTAGGVLNLEQAKRWLLAQKQFMEDIQIILTGGEPTIVRQWTEFVDWAYVNGFKAPIIYTNGLNIKDIAYIDNAREKAKVILTAHSISDDGKTRDICNLLNDMEVKHIVKVLTDKPMERPVYGKSRVIVEGIRKPLPKNMDEVAEIYQRYVQNLNGDNPHRWRYKGHLPFIDSMETAWVESRVFSVFPAGDIVNCHMWQDGAIGTIYDLGDISSNPHVQLAWCFPIENGIQRRNVTRCETLHYVNLMEGL